MRLIIATLLIIKSLTGCSQSHQNNSTLYKPEDYRIYDSTSTDRSGYFIKLYKSSLRENSEMKEYYVDSLRQIMVIRAFLKDNINNGPVVYFENFYPENVRKIIITGNYLNGEKDGEWLEYKNTDHKLSKRSFYSNGKKSGKWEYYDEKGKIVKTEQW